MIHLKINDIPKSNYKILFLGAHCDDIEIGCGGTVLKLEDEYPQIDITWIVFCGDVCRRQEAKKSAELFLKPIKKKKIVIKDYRDGYFPYDAIRIKNYFEQIKKSMSPDLIFTHHQYDRHQDHRLISKLTWNTFRNNLILEYEIQKYDGDLRSPNTFVPLSDEHCDRKIRYIMSSYESQKKKHWFKEDLFKALMRLRSVEAGSPSLYVEAFFSRKQVLIP